MEGGRREEGWRTVIGRKRVGEDAGGVDWGGFTGRALRNQGRWKGVGEGEEERGKGERV